MVTVQEKTRRKFRQAAEFAGDARGVLAAVTESCEALGTELTRT